MTTVIDDDDLYIFQLSTPNCSMRIYKPVEYDIEYIVSGTKDIFYVRGLKSILDCKDYSKLLQVASRGIKAYMRGPKRVRAKK